MEIGAFGFFLAAVFELPLVNVAGALQATPLTITAAVALILHEGDGWRPWTAPEKGMVDASRWSSSQASPSSRSVT